MKQKITTAGFHFLLTAFLLHASITNIHANTVGMPDDSENPAAAALTTAQPGTWFKFTGLGFRGGANTSFVNMEGLTKDQGLSRIPVFSGGISAEMMVLFKYLFIQPEVLFGQYKFKVQDSTQAAGFQTPVTYNLRYLEIPLFVKGRITLGAFRPFVLAGPVYGLMLTGNATVASNNYWLGTAASSLTAVVDLKTNYLEKQRLSVEAGAGVEIEMTLPAFFVLDVRYNLALSQLYNSRHPAIKMNGLKALAGFRYDFN